MNNTRRRILTLVLATLAGSLMVGCSHGAITGVNAAPNVTPATDRAGMIRWHQQHDKKPAASTDSGQ